MPVNPVDNRGYYLNLEVGGRRFPGAIVREGVEGLGNTEDWSIVRAIAGTGWQQQHKGRKPIEGIKVKCSLNAATPTLLKQAWIDHYQFVVHIRGAKPPKHVRPRALAATGTPFLGAGVKAVVYAGHTEPLFDTNALLVTYIFNEHTKATLIPIGPPEPAILNDTNPSPKTQQETALVNAVGSITGVPVPFTTLSERYPIIGAAGTVPQ